MEHRLPAPSIVVEWDNSLICGVGRPGGVLNELARQLRELAGAMDGQAELIVAFKPSRVSPEAVLPAVSASAGEAGWPAPVSIYPVGADATYVDSKNQGFTRTCREIVVFLDSDVVPEPGWLRHILSSFLDPGISVVAGHTYLERRDFYACAFALFWIFPTRCRQEGLQPTNYIFPNNVAFRREVFRRFPFPSEGFSHGNIFLHARSIWRGGFPVLRQMSARAAHPPPRGVAILRRAALQGYDLYNVQGEPGYLPPVPTFVRHLRRAARRIADRRRDLDAGWGMVAIAGAMALIYYGLVLAAQRVSRTGPRLVRRHFVV